MYRGFTGIILSGGKNNRMGTNKALLKIGGKEIIKIVYEKLKNIFGEVIVISNEPEKYEFLETKIYKDIYPGYGPISGIHSGLVNSKTEKNFIIACDMPLIKKELIEYLINIRTEKEIIIPTNNKYLQTLCAVYGKTCVPYIEKNIFHEKYEKEKTIKDKIQFSLFSFVMNYGSEIVDVTQSPFYDDRIFLSLNDNEDFERIKTLI